MELKRLKFEKSCGEWIHEFEDDYIPLCEDGVGKLFDIPKGVKKMELSLYTTGNEDRVKFDVRIDYDFDIYFETDSSEHTIMDFNYDARMLQDLMEDIFDYINKSVYIQVEYDEDYYNEEEEENYYEEEEE